MKNDLEDITVHFFTIYHYRIVLQILIVKQPTHYC